MNKKGMVQNSSSPHPTPPPSFHKITDSFLDFVGKDFDILVF
jgi:hypothetical protein